MTMSVLMITTIGFQVCALLGALLVDAVLIWVAD